MMFLLPVMLLLFSGGSTKVVRNFSGCGDFFKNRITQKLNGPQYKLICQTLGDKPYYVTLYDTKNRIPVYSAYKFMKNDCKVKRRKTWYIEPQLDDNNAGINMKSKGRLVLNNQASNRDYNSSPKRFERHILHRGHLAPVSQSNSKECADATFTLTNAAPQYSSFNQGQWQVVERGMITTVTNKCENYPAYIVTGVVPDRTNKRVPGKTYMDRVNVPICFWTAYCCQTNQGVFSGGAIGVNSKENRPPYPLTVIELERQLSVHYRAGAFTLFDDICRNANYVPVKHYNQYERRKIRTYQTKCLVN